MIGVEIKQYLSLQYGEQWNKETKRTLNNTFKFSLQQQRVSLTEDKEINLEELSPCRILELDETR